MSNSFDLMNLISVLIGSIGTYIASNKLLNKQYENEKKKLEIEVKEKKKTLINVVVYVLKQEILNNNEILDKYLPIMKTNEYEKIRDRFCDMTHLINYISTKEFECIKWELMKYCDDELVQNIIMLYDSVYTLKRNGNLNGISKNDFEKICKYKELYSNIISVLN